jgi:hypothetical protein
VFLAAILVPVAAFVVGICKAFVDSEQSRREALAGRTAPRGNTESGLKIAASVGSK